MQLKAALAQAWPEEDRATAPDTGAMHRLAQATGGRVHDIDNPPLQAGLFDRDGLQQMVAPAQIWPWLVIAAAIGLPIDVAVRRLVLKRDDSAVTVSRATGPPTTTATGPETASS